MNPADKVELPKKERFVANFYDSHEMNELFTIVRDTPLELPVMLAAFYGLRRSEVVGLSGMSLTLIEIPSPFSILLQHVPSLASA